DSVSRGHQHRLFHTPEVSSKHSAERADLRNDVRRESSTRQELDTFLNLVRGVYVNARIEIAELLFHDLYGPPVAAPLRHAHVKQRGAATEGRPYASHLFFNSVSKSSIRFFSDSRLASSCSKLIRRWSPSLVAPGRYRVGRLNFTRSSS